VSAQADTGREAPKEGDFNRLESLSEFYVGDGDSAPER